MSDLCYNCGSCHLPSPCPQDLKQCTICLNLGHAWNFCPTGVKLADSNYQYWALCHNCDKWHLPDVCEIPLHKCTVCDNGGHLEYFCPVNPLTRQATAGLANKDADTKTGVKRQRTSDSDVSAKADVDANGTSNGNSNGNIAEAMRAEEIRAIKVVATREVLGLVNGGFTYEQILAFMTRVLPIPAPLGHLPNPLITGDVPNGTVTSIGKEQELPTPVSPLFATSPPTQLPAAALAQTTAPSLLAPVMGGATTDAEPKAKRAKAALKKGAVVAGPDPEPASHQVAPPISGHIAAPNDGGWAQALQTLRVIGPGGSAQGPTVGNVSAPYGFVPGFVDSIFARVPATTAENGQSSRAAIPFAFGANNAVGAGMADPSNAAAGDAVVSSFAKSEEKRKKGKKPRGRKN